MKLLAKPKLELISKTLMDLAKVVVVASGLFTTPSPKIQLIGVVLVVILLVGGWLIFPADEEEVKSA